METQFTFIVELAKKYHQYNRDAQLLYQAVNELPAANLQDIYAEYGDPQNNFQPVNLLRAEIARRLSAGEAIDEADLEEIKEKIRVKDVNYFAHWDEKLLRQLAASKVTQRDIFASWQQPWRIFHTFFFRSKVKETVNLYQQQIATQLQHDLQLTDYEEHTVGFQGSQNFGADWAWLALFPQAKQSHQESYQFFLEFSTEPKAGLVVGSHLKVSAADRRSAANSYTEALTVLLSHREEIIRLNTTETAIEIVGDLEDDDAERDISYWWLNANPNIWSISNHRKGHRQTYTTHNEKGNKRRIYRYFKDVKPGDLLIGYESSPVKQIKALIKITKAIHQSETQDEVIEFEILEKYDVPVHWNELQHNPALHKCEVFINNQGSLFKLTEDEFDVIREVIDTKNILVEQQKSDKHHPYLYANDLDKPFLADDTFRKIVALLKRKKNIILQGPPGVGKTFVAKKLAYEIMGHCNDANVETIQFHQAYSYEDFIQGLRPSRNGGFELKNGVFYTFCQKAHAHPNRQFFFIIDEINRGNLSKIFGELMLLMEADKRTENWAIKLTYAEDEQDRFYIPENVHIIGTMNTADRSLAMVDYALRRRFAFVNLVPDFGNRFSDDLIMKGITAKLVAHIQQKIASVNRRILNDDNLGLGFQIGHAYFCTYHQAMDEVQWFREVLAYEIKPLLEEIWFDDLDKVEQSMDELRL